METKILHLLCRYDFLLLFVLLLCVVAGGISCFAQTISPAAASEPDPSSFSSGKDIYSGTFFLEKEATPQPLHRGMHAAIYY